MARITLILAIACAAASAHADPIKLFVIMGQSNAGDNAVTYSGMPPELEAPQENLYQYRITELETFSWNPMAPRLKPGAQSLYYGPELSFAHEISQRLDEAVAVVKFSISGSSLWHRWMPEPQPQYPFARNDLYAPAISKIQQATSQLTGLGYEPQLSAILWVQGEGDANYQNFAMEYDDNLLTFVDAVREDLNAPDVPFLFNQLHVSVDRPYAAEVRESQQNAATIGQNMYLFNVDDLTLNPDSVHFTTPTHLEVGRRFADLLAPSADYNFDGLTDDADLAIWTAALGNDRTGDGNSDGTTSGDDLLLWQRQLSIVPPPFTAVPEPTAGAVVFSLGGILMSRRKTRV